MDLNDLLYVYAVYAAIMLGNLSSQLTDTCVAPPPWPPYWRHVVAAVTDLQRNVTASHVTRSCVPREEGRDAGRSDECCAV
jgi:hypothetical protein